MNQPKYVNFYETIEHNCVRVFRVREDNVALFMENRMSRTAYSDSILEVKMTLSRTGDDVMSEVKRVFEESV